MESKIVMVVTNHVLPLTTSLAETTMYIKRNRIDMPFIATERDQYKGKNKSKRKYPKPR